MANLLELVLLRGPFAAISSDVTSDIGEEMSGCAASGDSRKHALSEDSPHYHPWVPCQSETRTQH